MAKKILKETEEKMRKTVEVVRREMAAMRTGRASPTLLEGISVDYYGVSTPLHKMCSISVPEPRLMVIQPWDKSSLPEVEKAILKSDLGLTPSNDGHLIRITIPALSEERRTELDRVVKKVAEEGRVAIRNERRAANEAIKSSAKGRGISEDQSHTAQEKIQDMTDRYIKEIEAILGEKEKEILEV